MRTLQIGHKRVEILINHQRQVNICVFFRYVHVCGIGCDVECRFNLFAESFFLVRIGSTWLRFGSEHSQYTTIYLKVFL